MEKFIQTLIYIHAFFGGVALLSGLVSMVAKKGNKAHKKAGLLFFYAMMLSGIIAMFVAISPNHNSPFLFSIGIFSLYFVFTGKRALRFKRKNNSLKIDKLISTTMLITGFCMILVPIIFTKSINIILIVFGVVGMVFSIKDLIQFKNPNKLKKGWLKFHLGKMIGAYISATTAFVVVNQFFPSIYGWFAPSILGGFVIAYWIKKINRKTLVN